MSGPHGQPPARVAVTGLGFVTPTGCDAGTVWETLVEGVSAVGPITRFDASAYPSRIAAEIHDFDAARNMDARTARHVGRFCQYAIAAARLARRDSGLNGDVDPCRVGVLVATGIGGLEEIERCHAALVERGWKRMKPAPMWIPNMASALVAIELGARGRRIHSTRPAPPAVTGSARPSRSSDAATRRS